MSPPLNDLRKPLTESALVLLELEVNALDVGVDHVLVGEGHGAGVAGVFLVNPQVSVHLSLGKNPVFAPAKNKKPHFTTCF